MLEFITEEEFDVAINSHEKVIIKFTADWCRPCQILNQILEKIVANHDIKIYQIDVEKEGDISHEMGITNIPKMLYYENGVKINESVGVIPEESILKRFE